MVDYKLFLLVKKQFFPIIFQSDSALQRTMKLIITISYIVGGASVASGVDAG